MKKASLIRPYPFQSQVGVLGCAGIGKESCINKPVHGSYILKMIKTLHGVLQNSRQMITERRKYREWMQKGMECRSPLLSTDG